MKDCASQAIPTPVRPKLSREFQDHHKIDDIFAGVYGFVFNRDSNWIYSIVDDFLYLKAEDVENVDAYTATATIAHSSRQNMHDVYRKMFQTGSAALYFSQCQDHNETWLPLFEKAYAKAHSSYDALRWGYPGYCLNPTSTGFGMLIYK